MPEVTYLDAEHGPRTAPGRVERGRVLIEADAVTALTGWKLESQGLCRDDVCVPVRDAALVADGAIDAERLARALGRPVVLDAEHAVVAVGDPSTARRGPIEAGRAPDFTLPQLSGGTFTFSSLGRRKKLLLAWSSW
jgi:hypothetical protein